MVNNKLITYNEKLYKKISDFFKRLFHKNIKMITAQNEDATEIINDKHSRFLKSISIQKDEEEIRLKKLQLQYDNGEITEKDICDEDINKLIEMYRKETNELNADTARRKNHIAQMLKKLKA